MADSYVGNATVDAEVGDPPEVEQTLDPTDWDEVRALGHRMLDESLDYLRTVRERPVWQSPPADVRAALDAPLPLEPQGLAKSYEDFRRNVLPYPTGNIHPRFWGWVMGTGTPGAVLAEMLAATMNSSASVFDDAPSLVERQVIGWLAQVMGFPPEARGLLLSGGSVANLVGLAVGLTARAGFDVRRLGVAASSRPLVLYASREVHSSVTKAVELLGLGRDALRLVRTNSASEIDLGALDEAIRADRAAGLRPFCIVGTAGTVNTGAFDDLAGLAGLAAGYGLWFHVDGAFGALAALSPALKGRLAGLERADSLAFDLHKWGYLPYEAGCTLVRDGVAHRAAFASAAPYLAPARGGILSDGEKFSDLGPQLSRGFRALKVWMALKEHGVARLGRLVEQNVAQAAHLARRVREADDLELLAPVPLNVVCFRYVGEAPERALDDVNRALLVELHRSGRAAPSGTTVAGKYALRVAITNHRSRREDFDVLVSEVQARGRLLAARFGSLDQEERP